MQCTLLFCFTLVCSWFLGDTFLCIWLYMCYFCSFGCIQGILIFGRHRNSYWSLQRMCIFSSKRCKLERSKEMGSSHFCQMCYQERLIFQSNDTHRGKYVSVPIMHGKWWMLWIASKRHNTHSWPRLYKIQRKCATFSQSRTCWKTSRQDPLCKPRGVYYAFTCCPFCDLIYCKVADVFGRGYCTKIQWWSGFTSQSPEFQS